MKVILIFAVILISTVKGFAKEDPVEFFAKEYAKKDEKWTFNEYENIISGTAAFIIGNVGYAVSDNSVLGLTYSAIQTIGIINIGQGIYKMNSPSLEGRFKDLLTNKKVKAYSKKNLAKHLVNIFGKEERAKRLSLFYSSSLLAFQYFVNASVYDSPGNLKNIYLFLGGVNSIVAAYTAFYKSSYEKALLGDDLDLNPFASLYQSAPIYGLTMTYRF